MAKQLRNSLIRIHWFKLALISAIASLLVLGLLGVKLYQIHSYHWHVDQQKINKTNVFGSRQMPEVLFANAVRYAEQGLNEKALTAYANVVAQANNNPTLRGAAFYNAGNLYLKQATDKLEQEGLPGWDVAGPLVALAKESYQKALRVNPSWSEAKYNYQLALRLAPTTHGMRGPQQYEDENIKQEEKPSGWPAMPGNPRGMP